MGEYADSMCGVYAVLIRDQVQSDDTDVEKVVELTEFIEKYCQTVGFAPGETPEHLEPHLFDGE